ncbi:hypothetical protein BDV40DRAFT_260435 [Aspergillus tamarii]|uniref:Gamma-glutamylcyclotransferase AIG2-like domain-containing protein n=1 Tax=Aspergillus tamarii TaxID=41984 RepID=A0A5N6V0X5_ASPTM|nr:hypothetical protein BDV40DRAFT_260435 [Aspergillus tamarii]
MSTPPGPPPSPPPPPPGDPRAKIPPFDVKLRNTPPNCFYQAAKPSPTVNLSIKPTGPYFIYGTLTDPCMVSEILNPDKDPELRPAFIQGYECKMWGQYTVLVVAFSVTVVEGSVY